MTRRINQIRQKAGVPVWQRNYYEHIIRDDRLCRYASAAALRDRALQQIRQCVQNNPQVCQKDPLHPKSRSH